ncbi:MAG: transglycosylase domain-containing protein [Amnibacterium sp.]
MSARTGRPRGAASALLGMLGVAVVAGLMITVGVAPAIALTGVGAKNGIGLFENLPDDLKIAQLQQKTEIYANSNGKPVRIASFYNQNREVIPWTDVSTTVKHATLAAEVVRFYTHGGVDPTGILRAIVSDIGGGGQQGASTITQQYVKNVCIQEAELLPTEQQVQAAYDECTGGIGRKLKEARLAIGLEKKYSKDQILLGYLNIAGFGGQIYGIESAAQYYFDTHAKDLTDAQAASLMAIVNAPNDLRLDDKANLAANKVRRDYILATELKHSLISQAAYAKAIATPVKPRITPTQNGCAQAKAAAYFCDYVVNTIRQNPAFGATEGQRYNNLQSAGWKIYTTLDLDLENKAKATMSSYVPAKSPSGTDLGGAAVTVQVGTGRVLSMVQSKTYDQTDSKATKGAGYTATSVNWNVDHLYGGATYGFQPGSTYKLFTLLDWLKNGHGVYERVNGDPRTLPQGDLKACGAPAAAWEVHNDEAGEGGPQTVYHATAMSINGAFASMGEQLDLCDIRDEAKALDVHRGDGGEVGDNPSSILGTDTVAPLTMATAYAAIADQGTVCSPIAIDKIVTATGKQVPVPASDCKQGVPKNIAIAAGYTLHGVFGGTASGDEGVLNGAFGMVKTGTTDSAQQTWEVGGTTKTTTAVWVGNVNGSTNLRTVYSYPGCGGEAANARHCVWQGIAGANEAKYPGDSSWPTPDAQFLYGQQVSVPNVAGLSIADATTTLQKAGFTVKTGAPQASDTVAAGLVAATNPGAGTEATPGSAVTLLPSSGPAPLIPVPGTTGAPGQNGVPNIVGMTQAEAFMQLMAVGLTPKGGYDGKPGNCTVSAQWPPQGSPAPSDGVVKYTVSGTKDQCEKQQQPQH